jgi:hypothetical protein
LAWRLLLGRISVDRQEYQHKMILSSIIHVNNLGRFGGWGGDCELCQMPTRQGLILCELPGARSTAVLRQVCGKRIVMYIHQSGSHTGTCFAQLWRRVLRRRGWRGGVRAAACSSVHNSSCALMKNCNYAATRCSNNVTR